MDTLNRSYGGGDIERTTSPHTDSPDICAAFYSFCNDCLDHIPCLEAKVDAPLFGAGSWEAVLINTAHLARLMPRGFNMKRRMTWVDINLLTAFSDTSRVNPMHLWIMLFYPIKFRAPLSRLPMATPMRSSVSIMPSESH